MVGKLIVFLILVWPSIATFLFFFEGRFAEGEEEGRRERREKEKI